MPTIYTHDEASKIIDEFEDILSRYNIHIPSPEDDQREEDNMVGLYGSTYSDLLDNIEERLIVLLAKHTTTTELISYEYSGEY